MASIKGLQGIPCAEWAGNPRLGRREREARRQGRPASGLVLAEDGFSIGRAGRYLLEPLPMTPSGRGRLVANVRRRRRAA
jgi:hypothetical protein